MFDHFCGGVSEEDCLLVDKMSKGIVRFLIGLWKVRMKPVLKGGEKY